MSKQSVSLDPEAHGELIRLSNEHGGVSLARITEIAVREWAKLPMEQRIRTLVKNPVTVRRGPRRKPVTT